MSSSEGKTCNKCGKRGLNWDKQFFDRVGKWKLENHRRADGKWCNKPPETLMVKTKDECQLCPLCEASSFGLIKSKDPRDLELHLAVFHSDGEKKTDLDFRMEMGMNRLFLKYWTGDPHFYKYSHLK